MNIEFVQYKDNNDNEQKLKFLSEYSDKNYAGQFISDIQHDEINILGKASKKSSKLENELIEYTSSYSDNLLELVGNFTEFQYNSKQEIDTKKETELFVVDVFSGKYQIKGFNNFFDCTSNENLKNIREKIDKYNQNSPTYIFSKKTNCDLLLNIYFKYIDSSFLQIPYDTDTSNIIEKELSETISDTSYNTLVNNFWKKLIYLVELILKKDETILQEDSFTIEIIEKAIDILKKFKFEFDDQGLKLISSNNNNSAIWAPTQFSLAQKITDLYKIESKKYAKNPENQPKYSLKAVLPRKEPNESKNETVNLISTYLNISRIDLKTNILVLSICKFLGDTSHILMTLILLKVKKFLVEKYSIGDKTSITLSDGKEILLEPLKINLQLSERPMMIRSCLLDKYIIDSFELNDSEDLNHLIIFMKHVELLKNKYNEINDKQEQLDFDEKEVEEEVEEQEEEVGEEIGKEEKIPKFCYMYSRDENYLLEKKKYKIKLMMEKIKEKKDIFREPSNEILKFIFSDQNIDEKLDDKYFNDNFKNSKDNCKFIEDIYNICCLFPINNLFKNDDEKIIDGIINTVDKCVAITIQYRFSGAQSSRNKKPIAIKFHKQLNSNNQLELQNILNKFKSLYEYNNLIEKLKDKKIFNTEINNDLYNNTKITNIIEKISKLNDNDEFNNVLAKNEINDQGIVFQIDFNKNNKGKTITNIINYVSKLSEKFKSTTTGGVVQRQAEKKSLLYLHYESYDIINDIIYTIYKNINIYLYFDYHSLQKIINKKEFPNEKKKEIFDLVIKVLNEEYGFSDEDNILGEKRSYEQVQDIYKNYYSNENNKPVEELFKQYIIFLLDLIEYNYILKLKTKKPYTKYGTKRRIKTIRPRTKPSPHTPDRTKRRKTSSRSILHTKHNNTRKRKKLESISRTRASSRSILHTKKRKKLEPILRTRARARSILHTKKRKRLESISRARSLSRRKRQYDQH